MSNDTTYFLLRHWRSRKNSRIGTQNSDSQRNDTQRLDTQHYDIYLNDTQQRGIYQFILKKLAKDKLSSLVYPNLVCQILDQPEKKC